MTNDDIIYADYMKRLLGLTSYRSLSLSELYGFIKKRKKLLFLFGGKEPKANSQISFNDAIDFIITEFSKKLPSVGSRALSLLYLGNNKKLAKTFEYRPIDIPGVLSNYLRKKIERVIKDIDGYLSKILFIIFELNVLMKKTEAELQAYFEVDLDAPEGIARKDILMDIINKIKPLKLYENDVNEIFKVFSSPKDDTRMTYKKFIEVIGCAEVLKQRRCMIPIFSVCYAILNAYMDTFEEIPMRLCSAISSRLDMDALPSNFMEYIYF